MAYAEESITLIIYVYLYTPVEIYLCPQSKSGLIMAINMVSMIFDKISITAKINFFNIYIMMIWHMTLLVIYSVT